MSRLPAIPADGVVEWVRTHLGDLACDDVVRSPLFPGGQRAADDALARLDVSGYAARRNEVWPPERRGATRLSPYIRHGLLTLSRVWDRVEGAPSTDREKFRSELLWQEYARHLYGQVGGELRRSLRFEQGSSPRHWSGAPWDRTMACVDLSIRELEAEGWMVNQTRMWMASQWAVRAGADWWDGEEHFFRHLLDGSRAANGLGWQWTVGAQTGRPYGFSRSQVEKRAPGLCDTCERAEACPIGDWPDASPGDAREPSPWIRAERSAGWTAGPGHRLDRGEATTVWLTAESLGSGDPASAAHPDLPSVFVFDVGLLRRLRLSGKRLVFMAEALAEIGERRPLEIHLGDPGEILAGHRLAATFTPVPGWRALSRRLEPAVIHPWPWLRLPDGGSVQSFTAWNRRHQERERRETTLPLDYG